MLAHPPLTKYDYTKMLGRQKVYLYPSLYRKKFDGARAIKCTHF